MNVCLLAGFIYDANSDSDIYIFDRRFYLLEALGADMCVYLRCFGAFVSQEFLDYSEVGTLFKQVSCI